MLNTFTVTDLIKFIYKETSVSESLAIKGALKQDPELKEEFYALYEAYIQLPKVRFNPSTSCIQNILTHSQKASFETHV